MAVRSKWSSQTRRAQDLHVNSSSCATFGQLAIDGHGRNGANAERLGTLGNLAVMHVEHDHVARRAG
jgi:hypothetical protein